MGKITRDFYLEEEPPPKNLPGEDTEDLLVVLEAIKKKVRDAERELSRGPIASLSGRVFLERESQVSLSSPEQVPPPQRDHSLSVISLLHSVFNFPVDKTTVSFILSENDSLNSAS